MASQEAKDPNLFKERWYTVGELCAITDRSDDQIYLLLKQGQLVGEQAGKGKEWLIPESEARKVFPLRFRDAG